MPPADEAAEADRLEPEMPLLEEDGRHGIDAERTKPVPDDGWSSPTSGA